MPDSHQCQKPGQPRAGGESKILHLVKISLEKTKTECTPEEAVKIDEQIWK